MAAMAMQFKLNDYHFERTVDWRVGFPDLVKCCPASMQERLRKCLIKGQWCFAESVQLPTSCIDVEDENGMPGFYTSKIIVPKLTITIYLDNLGIIERALRIWNVSAFTEEGFMIPPIDAIEDNRAVQKIEVHRIDPLKLTDIQNMIVTEGYAAKDRDELDISDFREETAIEIYTFRGYLSKIPDYSGNNLAKVRTLTLTFKLCSATSRFTVVTTDVGTINTFEESKPREVSVPQQDIAIKTGPKDAGLRSETHYTDEEHNVFG